MRDRYIVIIPMGRQNKRVTGNRNTILDTTSKEAVITSLSLSSWLQNSKAMNGDGNRMLFSLQNP